MKSFLHYLVLSILLLICYYEKKYAGLLRISAKEEPMVKARYSAGRLAAKNKFPQVSPLRLQINDNSVTGTYRPADLKTDIELTGVVKNQTELIGMEPGKKTRVPFKATGPGSNSLLLLTGRANFAGRNLYPF